MPHRTPLGWVPPCSIYLPWPWAQSSTAPPPSRRRALLQRIHAFIEARLGDSELNPTTVADAHYISVRYLHKLFQTEQVTVADHIRRRRLDRCRRDLLDPGWPTDQ